MHFRSAFNSDRPARDLSRDGRPGHHLPDRMDRACLTERRSNKRRRLAERRSAAWSSGTVRSGRLSGAWSSSAAVWPSAGRALCLTAPSGRDGERLVRRPSAACPSWPVACNHGQVLPLLPVGLRKQGLPSILQDCKIAGLHPGPRMLRASVLVMIMLIPPHDLAAESILATAMAASSSVVTIVAELGAIRGTKPKPYLDPSTGYILVRQKVKAMHQKRTGAGVIVDASGLIVTNAHTVANAMRITVTLRSEATFSARPVYMAGEVDLVILQIVPTEPLQAVRFSDSDQIQLNDQVYYLGHSKMLRNTLSGGQVSGIGMEKLDTISGTRPVKLIRVNFDVYKSDSGTPVLDKDGDFLGFVVAAPARKNDSTFIIPSNAIRAHFQSYLESKAEEESSTGAR